MKTLLILNDPPYGTERSYNGLRLARWLLKQPDQEVHVFLMGDAAACARAGQKVAQGFYNIGDMVYAAGKAGARIGACGTCMDARGIAENELVEGAHRSTMDELTAWTLWADKVIVF
jgi:uncharacterized protein involved in oxidation of intracellular sulfur